MNVVEDGSRYQRPFPFSIFHSPFPDSNRHENGILYENKLMIRILNGLSIFLLLSTLTGCSVVEGIFKAGVWVGVLIVAAVIGLIIFLVSRAGKK